MAKEKSNRKMTIYIINAVPVLLLRKQRSGLQITAISDDEIRW